MNSGSSIKVLLVDDQRIIGEAIKRMLEAEGGIVFLHCDNPENALKTALEFSPTVILQDLVMPGVDGLSLVQAYKSNEVLKEVPVIVLSSEEDVNVKLQAFSLHASDYMVKIPNRIELVARIKEHAQWALRVKELEAALAAAKGSASTGLPAPGASGRRDPPAGLVAAMVHEIETPLQYISSNLMFFGDVLRSLSRFRVKLARLAIPPELAAEMKRAADEEDLDFVFDDAPKALRQSQDEIARAAQIAKALAFLAVPAQAACAQQGACDVNALLRQAASMLKERQASLCEFKLSLAETLPKASACQEQMLLAFLIMAASATFAVEARFGKSSGKGSIEFSSSLANGKIRVELKDNGASLPCQLEDLRRNASAGQEDPRAPLLAVKALVVESAGDFETFTAASGDFCVAIHLLAV